MKAQEPRVMTLDEIRVLPVGTDVWIEERDGTIRTETSDATIDSGWFETLLHGYLMADYGITWRPWTARPTDEQRKADLWIPRILTKEEAWQAKKAFCEFRYGVEPQYFVNADIQRWLSNGEYPYGKTWRCWSERVTDEQREEAAWNG